MSYDEIRDPRAFRWVESGVSGLAPPREWDVVTTASCDAGGDECGFVAVSATDTVHEHGDGDAVPCLAAALAGELEPPYRAIGRRRKGDVWAVGAVAIDLAELPFEGEELEFIVTEDGSRTLTVDGRAQIVGMDALEVFADGVAGYVLRGRRVRGRTWEVQTDPI